MEFYKEIAKGFIGEYSHIKCEKCGKVRKITELQASNYLQHGWPKCCGYTMRLHPKDV